MNRTEQPREDKLNVTITRKRMKNLYLRVLAPDGRVAISAPLRTSDAEIQRFLESRANWILKQRARILSAKTAVLEDGGAVPYFGGWLQLRLVPHAGRTRLERQGDTLVLWIKPEADEAAVKKALGGWYRAELLSAAEAMLPECEQIVGKRAGELKIRDMKTRWGTCNVRTALITLNLRLAEKPPECLRYVLTHELCHLHEAGHNERFWKRMDVYYPDWKRIRKRLKER